MRERVLRRLAERQDVDGVAREFGLRPDQLSAWLGDAVDHGRRLDAASPETAPRASAPTSSSGRAATAAAASSGSNRGLLLMLSIFMGSGIVTISLISWLGAVAASRACQHAMAPVAIVVGVSLFLWRRRLLMRDFERADAALPASKVVVLAMMVGPLCGIST